ncbi:MAG: hypothetical protein DRG82_02445, partial [Deltaproteobacteria bacterium]
MTNKRSFRLLLLFLFISCFSFTFAIQLKSLRADEGKTPFSNLSDYEKKKILETLKEKEPIPKPKKPANILPEKKVEPARKGAEVSAPAPAKTSPSKLIPPAPSRIENIL